MSRPVSASESPRLEATDVTFRYGRRRPAVLSALSWAVAPGSRTMLLGPNGAGKSTLLKVLSGQLRAASGTVAFGGDVRRHTLFRRVGWMPQDILPLRGFTVRDQVEFAAWVGGSAVGPSRDAARTAVSAVRLDDKADEQATHLSGGQLRRLGLAQALVRDQQVLLLDEPTAGLDPAQTANFREILRSLEPTSTVVVSTHQVSDLIDDVDRIAVLVAGAIRFDGSVDDFAALGSGGKDPAALSDIFVDLVKGGLH